MTGPGNLFEPTETIQFFSERIAERWKKATRGILEVAEICFQASEKLSANQRKILIQSLPFGQATFSKLVAIGQDTRLKSPQVAGLLPAKYSVLYELTKLSDAQVQTALEMNAISPKLRRTEVAAIFDQFEKDAAKNPVQSIEATAYAAFSLEKELSYEQMQSLHMALEELTEKFELNFTYNDEFPTTLSLYSRFEDEVGKREAKVQLRVRQLARAQIRNLKKHKIGKGEKWGFDKDEIYIGAEFDEVQIAQVFSLVGIDTGVNNLVEQARLLTLPTKRMTQLERQIAALPKKFSPINVDQNINKNKARELAIVADEYLWPSKKRAL
jgi:hypothetical protein